MSFRTREGRIKIDLVRPPTALAGRSTDANDATEIEIDDGLRSIAWRTTVSPPHPFLPSLIC